MLSKAKIKYLHSLQQKKNRLKEQVFVVEGEKILAELLSQELFKLHSIYATEDWINKNITNLAQIKPILTSISSSDLKKISSLKTPNQVLAVVHMPNYTPLDEHIQTSLNLVLENIQDPGNMGTIIRIADWFGIPHVFCSKGCVDIFNPKVVQASMGSLFRIKIHYTDLDLLFDEQAQLPVYGAVLGGNNAFETPLKTPSFLVIGNEGNGLSDHMQSRITEQLTIPQFGKAESLNAAVATGILCALFRQ